VRAAPLAFASVLLSCGLQACTLVRHGAPSEQQFRESRPTHPYVADPVRTATIIDGARRLHICSRISEVRETMGMPDFGVRTSDSAGNPNRAVKWTYVLREGGNSAGQFEQAVHVEIDDAGWVIGILPRGAVDIPASVVIDDPGCPRT
jgi:hypothetical protein